MDALSSQVTTFRMASLITAVNLLTASVLFDRGLISAKSVLPIGSVPTDALFIFASMRRREPSRSP